MHVVTVEFKLARGAEARFLDAVLDNARRSLEAEEGCLVFDVLTSGAEPDTVFLYEVYRSEADFQAHLREPHFAQFSQQVQPWVTDKQVRAWELRGSRG